MREILDPEGLLIAQKLSQYYKGEFHYWHMETADYEKCRSEKVISPKRMKILERITDERLNPVLEKIEEHGTAGYQEMLVEDLKQSEGQLLATNAYALLTSDYFSFAKTQCAVFKGNRSCSVSG